MAFLVATRFKLKAGKERCGRKMYPFTSRLGKSLSGSLRIITFFRALSTYV